MRYFGVILAVIGFGVGVYLSPRGTSAYMPTWCLAYMVGALGLGAQLGRL